MILLLDCGSSKTYLIADMIDAHCDVHVVPILDFEVESLGNYKGVVISGSPISITEKHPETFIEKIAFIKDCEIPVLGICFGHQIIGLSFGATAHRMREDRDWQLIEVYEENPLTVRLPTEFEMMEDHCETISIPPNFKLLASSDACINEMMAHNDRPIYGVQFHPELSGNHGAVIIENFVRLCMN